MKKPGSNRARHKAQSPVAKFRVSWFSLGIATIFLIGAVVTMLPTIANWYSEIGQAKELNILNSEVRDLGAETLKKQIADAQLYNTTLTGGALLAAGERIPLSEATIDRAQHLQYDDLLRADSRGLMGRIKIPSINVDLPIFHGTSDEVLKQGAGHLEGTALPVGGAGTRSVISAHRGLASAVLFTHLDQVKVGDTFTIEVFGEVLTYKVISTEVVEPNDSKALYPVPDEDLVTLVTCTPLGINSHRILVTGERVEPTPKQDLANAGKPPTIPGFPWWMLILGGLVVLLGIYIWISGRRPQASYLKEEKAVGHETEPAKAGVARSRVRRKG
ncbi:MAG: class C sortase [Cryobacterium sp.]|nr:class C sortase [Cryobacterium sp.]